jgi:acyl carrier protein
MSDAGTTPDKDQILEVVRAQLVEIVDAAPDDVQLDTKLAEGLDADSIDLVELAGALERQYSIGIEDHEVYDLETVGQLVDLVATKAAQA